MLSASVAMRAPLAEFPVKGVSLPFESIKNGRNILRSPDPMWLNFQAEIAARGLNVILLQHGRGIGGIEQNCQAAETGDKLRQEFEPLTGAFGRFPACCARAASGQRLPRRREA
jgi:hypothetical protein